MVGPLKKDTPMCCFALNDVKVPAAPARHVVADEGSVL